MAENTLGVATPWKPPPYPATPTEREALAKRQAALGVRPAEAQSIDADTLRRWAPDLQIGMERMTKQQRGMAETSLRQMRDAAAGVEAPGPGCAECNYTGLEASRTGELSPCSKCASGGAPPVEAQSKVLVPVEPDDALLRPFYLCPPEELKLAWAAMLRIAEGKQRRASGVDLPEGGRDAG